MKIELTDDNGMLHDGKPTLVVLVIDGKHRIPYEATKTIQELYEDVAKMNPEDRIYFSSPDGLKKLSEFPREVVTSNDSVTVPITDEIEKEDIVKCVKVHNRGEGLTNVEVPESELEVGKEYRVFNIKKELGKVVYYELMDDNAKEQNLIGCLLDEVELLRKRKVKTNPVKKDYKQEMMKCSNCSTMNALELIEDKFVGECVKCKAKLQKARSVAKPATG